MKLRRLFLFLCMQLLIIGCSRVEHPFQIEVNEKNINNQISCSITPGWNSLERDDILTVTIENNSNEVVKFNYDFDMRIFLFENDEKWVELEDLEEEFIQEEKLLFPESNIPVPVSTRFPDTAEDIIVRVYVQGEVLMTKEKVVAYIDVELK